MEDTSYKLKIMAIAGGVTMTEMCRQIIAYVFNEVDPEKIKQAQEELKRRNKKC